MGPGYGFGIGSGGSYGNSDSGSGIDWDGVLSSGAGLLGSYLNRGGGGDVLDILRQQRQADYDIGKQNYDAYLQYQQMANSIANSNRAAAAARAGQMARARQQEYRSSQKALKKGLQTFLGREGDVVNLYKPFLEAGSSVQAGKANAFNTGLNQLNTLGGNIFSNFSNLQKRPSVFDIRI